MKASVIREMSLTELRERIENDKSSYQKLKMNHVVSTLENPLKLKYARKAIARMATELTKRERDEVAGSATTKAPAVAKKVAAKETDDNTEA
ncbi:MAG: 50S ribosomal protein L29 [Flavobacteriales bacterium]|nr:50S ribosomal protein L29 [Flavobacteriales bacterium]